ncbi:hypothetical protein ACQEV4_25120 [Streptomyces shenzhenensis]|uniref:hypothetical protein n=1 Tax=Streptomyces shenzhenensis TaxID=943815 RepID=UPI003D8A3BB6
MIGLRQDKPDGVGMPMPSWSSGNDLLAHVSQPFMQNYFSAIADLIEGDLEARWLKPVTTS